MSKFILPKTNSTYREAAVPKEGDLLFDTTNKQVYVGDGTTPGGVALGVSGGTAGELTAGFNLEVTGSTVGQKRFKAIETLTTGGTVFAGHAYKITATSGSTVNAELFDHGITGLDATIEVYLNGTGYLHTGNNLVIKGRLEPDAINNCVVRFHDGDAVLEALDSIGGYIVTTASGSTAGTLVYGLTDVSSGYSPYIVFNQELNGTPIDFAGTEVTDERHVVGNGYAETTLTGAVDCGTSKFTVANLGLSNVQVTGGIMTLGDAFIPSGSTVAVSGGGLAVEKVTGAGSDSVVDLGGTNVTIPSGTTASANGCTFSGGSAGNGGAFNLPLNAKVVLSGVTASGNNGTNGGFLFVYSGNADIISSVITGNNASLGGAVYGMGTLNISSSIISGNTAGRGADFYPGGATVNLLGGNIIGGMQLDYKATVTFAGPNTVDLIDARVSGSYDRGGTVTISSGASINLTDSIAPGGGITVLTGGCTVNGVEIAGGTYTSIVSSGGSAVVNE